MKKTFLFIVMTAIAIGGWSQSILSEVFNLPDERERLLGGDASLLPSYEQKGTVYRDAEGNAVGALDFFKQNGWDCIRVRLFVDPSKAPGINKGEGVCQDIDYVARFGKQIKQKGMKLMLDFHYSDTWADPGKQFIPHQWATHTEEALCDSVYAHTKASLMRMKAAGAE
ncbi:MAG: glycosyl hydrolase 53 family protein, partial [Prevotellaceae bacterium]|nr:glycosyl hydrolase 53 family protein [Prevotellaceae bacterium]